jgi:hypothetical protein
MKMSKLVLVALLIGLALPALAADRLVTVGDVAEGTDPSTVAGTLMYWVRNCDPGDVIKFDGDYTIKMVPVASPFFGGAQFDTWTIEKSCTIDGETHNIVITTKNGTYEANSGLYVMNENVIIKNITVEKKQTAVHFPNNFINPQSGGVVDNVTLLNTGKGISIEAQPAVDNPIIVQNCTIDVTGDLSEWGIVFENTATGNAQILNNYVTNADVAGIGVKSNVSGTISNVLISGNTFLGNAVDILWETGTPTAAPAITNVSSSAISGTAVAGASVEVYAYQAGKGPEKELVGTVTADGSGAWTLTEDLSGYYGYTFLATATDATALNTSEFSTGSLLEAPMPAAGTVALVLLSGLCMLGGLAMRKRIS